MKLKKGRRIVLSDEGRRVLGRRVRCRNKGTIIGRSRKYDGCYNIKWDDMRSVELLHGKFIEPARGRHPVKTKAE